MIVQITGSYGSGKSTIVRTLFPLFQGHEDVLSEGRRTPLGHVLGGRIFLLGNYVNSVTTGGADTIKSLDLVFSTVREQHALRRDVVMEGIYLLSMPRVAPLARECPVTILQLTTSLEDCLAGIMARRAALGKDTVVDPKHTTTHYKKSLSFCSKMKFLGVPVEKVTRETGPQRLRELLGVAG